MQKGHGQTSHFHIVMPQNQLSTFGAKDTKIAPFDVVSIADLRKGFDVFLGNGQHHALLGFADPNFGGRQTVVLQWRPFQLNFGTKFLSHLSDRTGKAARATISHGPEQTS